MTLFTYCVNMRYCKLNGCLSVKKKCHTTCKTALLHSAVTTCQQLPGFTIPALLVLSEHRMNFSTENGREKEKGNGEQRDSSVKVVKFRVCYEFLEDEA